MAGILTKGIALSYKAGTAGDYTELTNLMEIPEIGNGEKEMIDVTVLTDEVKKSIAGLGDSAQTLAFKFLYEKEQFQALAALAQVGIAVAGQSAGQTGLLTGLQHDHNDHNHAGQNLKNSQNSLQNFHKA